MAMRSYTGGKGGAGVYQQVINQMPPHETYIEPFLGAGAVLRIKRPAARSIGIELDGQVLAERWRGDEVPGLQLVNANALEFLAGFPWQGGELVYCDPPYLLETRRNQDGYYRCEMTAEDHADLLALLMRLPAPVILSGYWSELYADQLQGWRVVTYTTGTRGGGSATEYLWCNFPAPVALHDYRFLGNNFRERERITRRQRRWRARLARMKLLERQALLWAIQEAGFTIVDHATNSDAAGGIAENGGSGRYRQE